jgi:site-specific recombinase XerD
MPLPADVGEALVAYLREARPRVQARHVFLTCRAPRGPIRPDLVGDVVQRACLRAGIPQMGPHRLRHALAEQMLRRGAGLTAIGQVLRHQDLATTALYAKVDFTALREVAQPWPGAAS